MGATPIRPTRRFWLWFFPRYSVRLLICLLSIVCLWLGVVGHRARNQRRLVEDLVPRLGELRNVQYSMLPEATNEGLTRLHEKVPNLEVILLEYTHVTDEALIHLAHLEKLQVVMANRTRITEAGVKRLQESLPGCQVAFSDPLPTSD